MSTKTDLPDKEIVRIYGKRWDIEVFFKMMKHCLHLEKEAQLRDYDGITGHITISMVDIYFRHLSKGVMMIPKLLATYSLPAAMKSKICL